MILVNLAAAVALAYVGMVPKELHRSQAVCSKSRLGYTYRAPYMILFESAAPVSTEFADCEVD